MKYIIMCGGKYQGWTTPKQLLKINGETIVERTIRLLRNCGVTDIAVSTTSNKFDDIDIPKFRHNNPWIVYGYDDVSGRWVDGFYPTDEPACYILGDVVFSPEAIKTIVSTNTTDIEFFASAPPFATNYPKEYAEPFAFKVVNQNRFRKCIEQTKHLEDQGLFERPPIAWELWQVIKDTPINEIDYTNYTIINDYTCDIDWLDEVKLFEKILTD